MLDHELPQLVTTGDIPLPRFLLQLSNELRRSRHPDVGGDKNLLDSLPKLLVLNVPELRNGGVELSDERGAATAEALLQPAKPPAGLLPLGDHLRCLVDRTRLRQGFRGLGLIAPPHVLGSRLLPLSLHLFSRGHIFGGFLYGSLEIFGEVAVAFFDILSGTLLLTGYRLPVLLLFICLSSEKTTPRARHRRLLTLPANASTQQWWPRRHPELPRRAHPPRPSFVSDG